MNHEELTELAKGLEAIEREAQAESVQRPLRELSNAGRQAERAWSGSWLGYHSRVYYKQLKPPPPGARFSSEWGFTPAMSNPTTGEWHEYDFEGLVRSIAECAGSPDLGSAEQIAEGARRLLDDSRSELDSILDNLLEERQDSFLEKLRKDAQDIQGATTSRVISALAP